MERKYKSGFVWQFPIPSLAINDYMFVDVNSRQLSLYAIIEYHFVDNVKPKDFNPKPFNTRRRGIIFVKQKVHLIMDKDLYYKYTFGRIDEWRKSRNT